MGEFQESLEEAFGKKLAWVIGSIFGLICIYLLFSFALSFWPFSVARDLTTKVVNANAIIQNYEWYYDMKSQIDASRANYKVAKQTGMVEANGMLMVLNNMIAEYNSKSRQITRNLWKSNDLPYQIELETGE